MARSILLVVDSIPTGRVLTYGDVAALLGSRAARFVGTVLRNSGSEHPWWRVVRSGGHPPTGHEAEAYPRYLAEGTPLAVTSTGCGYRVEYAGARWIPSRSPVRDTPLKHEPSNPLRKVPS